MNDFEFTNDGGADEVFVTAQVEAPTNHVDPACDDMYMLAGRIVMQNIAAEMSITESHVTHVIICKT